MQDRGIRLEVSGLRPFDAKSCGEPYPSGYRAGFASSGPYSESEEPRIREQLSTGQISGAGHSVAIEHRRVRPSRRITCKLAAAVNSSNDSPYGSIRAAWQL